MTSATEKKANSSRRVDLVYLAGVAPELEITAGAVWEDPTGEGASSGTLPVIMHDNLAADMGVRPGEKFRVAPTAALQGTEVEIVGLWRGPRPGRHVLVPSPPTSR